MDVLTNIGRIPAALWGVECVVCREQVGCCYTCAHVGCGVTFHPTCAQAAGYEMSLEEKEEGEDFYFSAYCKQHSHQPEKDRGREEERKEGEDSRAPTTPSKLRSPPPSHLNRPFLSPRSAAFTTPPPTIHTSLNSSSHSSLPSRPLPFGKRLFGDMQTMQSSPYATPHSYSSSAAASPFPSPSPSPSVSFWPSPSSSPFSSTVNSPSNAAVEGDDDDQFTDRRSFHALVESYFRPLTPIDMLRLGFTAPPPSIRSSMRLREMEQSRRLHPHRKGGGEEAAASLLPHQLPPHLTPSRPLTAFPSQGVHESASGLQRKFTSPHSSPVLGGVERVEECRG